MSTKQKGRRAVVKCVTDFYHRDNGWLVDNVEKHGRFVKQKDLFGLFDIMAIHPERNPIFIQVTCNKPHVHKNYIEFSIQFPLLEIMQYVNCDKIDKAKGWLIFQYKNGEMFKCDEREKSKTLIKKQKKNGKK